MHKKGIYYTIASAILFGITPLLTKCIYQYGADSITVVFYRSILVALILALLLIQQRISFHINRSALRSIVTLAFCGSGLTTLLLFTSLYRYGKCYQSAFSLSGICCCHGSIYLS